MYVTDPDVRDMQVRSLTPGVECSFTVMPISEENAAASYTVEGKTNLADEKWAESNDANRAGLRFFRVRVEPKWVC